jgi:hypothetical protein
MGRAVDFYNFQAIFEELMGFWGKSCALCAQDL